MSVRAYFLVWGLTALVAALIFVTGNFTMMTAVVFGFIAFGLTFMGMMNVLPIAVTHTAQPKPEKPAKVEAPAAAKVPATAFNTWKSA